MKNKGQTAMEYLMTYGWAILIIIVVVAALYAMGVFSTKGSVTCSPCFSYFAFVDYNAGTFKVRNGANEITITAAEAVDEAGAITTLTPSICVAAACEAGSDITITDVPITGIQKIAITYSPTGGVAGHTDSATIHN